MATNLVLTEVELIQQCIAGNRQCQEMLYKNHASKMFGICLGYISDREAAKDVLQEGFIKVFSSLQHPKPVSQVHEIGRAAEPHGRLTVLLADDARRRHQGARSQRRPVGRFEAQRHPARSVVEV